MSAGLFTLGSFAWHVVLDGVVGRRLVLRRARISDLGVCCEAETARLWTAELIVHS